MVKIPSDILKIIDQWIDYKRLYDGLPGLSVGITTNKQTVFAKAYGYSNLEKKQKTTPLTVYRIASVSKVFTALGIIKLAQQEKLKLDDPVVKYLPEFTSKRQPRQNKITIRQLINHNSLITRDGSYGQFHFQWLQYGLLHKLLITDTADFFNY